MEANLVEAKPSLRDWPLIFSPIFIQSIDFFGKGYYIDLKIRSILEVIMKTYTLFLSFLCRAFSVTRRYVSMLSVGI